MNRRSLATLMTLLILTSFNMVFPYPQTAYSGVQDSQGQSATVPLIFYLGGLAKQYDCFFTLEEAWEESESRNVIEGYSVANISECKNLEEELEYLRLNVPYLTYEIREGFPRIVHILDTRLMYRDGYGLESTIRGIDFEGTLNDLITTISKQGIQVSPEELFFLGDNEVPDRNTVAKVEGEWLKVRDALTNFVALERRRGRFLWIARTKLSKGEATYIYYPWPGEKTK